MKHSTRLASIAILISIGIYFGTRPEDEAAGAAEEKSENWFSQKVEVAPSVAVSGANAPGKTDDDRNAFHVPPGFKIEHLFSVPKNELGSWVSMAVDNKGRLIVCDQEAKGLCRVTPPPVPLTPALSRRAREQSRDEGRTPRRENQLGSRTALRLR